jgi:hypothetical protein
MQQAESMPQSGSGPDYVLELLKKFNLPLTRDNYLGLAYPEGIPQDWDVQNEMGLPQEIRQA